MTQTEWVACAEPGAMLERLNAGPSDAERELRLALCACCRRVSAWLGPRGRAAVEAAEGYADGTMPAARLRDAAEYAAAEAGSAERHSAASQAGWAAAWLAQERLFHPDQVLRSAATAAAHAAVPYRLALEEVYESGGDGPQPLNARWSAAYQAERAAQATLLREVFGAPLPDAPAPAEAWRAWDGGTVPRLAAHVYAARDFDALPVLADALEDAGCTDAAVLGHCRGAGPHARGCWVLDLVLGNRRGAA
jgi:hypothetical protein